MKKKPPAHERPTVHVRTRQEWRDWLHAHHATVSEIWLVFDKRHTGETCIEYEDSIEEALCFGWVDSLVKRLDEDRYARKFTPRKPDSRWSTINRQRYARVEAKGLLTEAGLQRPPTARSGDAPPRPATTTKNGKKHIEIPAYIAKSFKANRAAWKNFESMAPSHRWNYVMWIDSAKRPETREKRIGEAIVLLCANEKLGIK